MPSPRNTDKGQLYRNLILFASLIAFTQTVQAQGKDYTRTYRVGEKVYDLSFRDGGADTYIISSKEQGTGTKDSLVVHGLQKEVIKGFLGDKLDLPGEGWFNKQGAVYRDLLSGIDTAKIILNANGMANYTTSTNSFTGAGAAAGFGITVNWPYSGRRINVMATVTQSRDTITGTTTADFGQAILVPGIRKFSILVMYRNLYDIKRGANGSGWGWGTFVNSTPFNWKTYRYTSAGSTERDSVPVFASVTPVTFEALLSRTMLYAPSASNPIRITIDFGAALKYIGDDGLSDEDQKLFLGSTQDFFMGPILGIDMRVADSHIYFYGTYLVPGNKVSVAGLTGPQLQGGITLSAAIAEFGKTK